MTQDDTRGREARTHTGGAGETWADAILRSRRRDAPAARDPAARDALGGDARRPPEGPGIPGAGEPAEAPGEDKRRKGGP